MLLGDPRAHQLSCELGGHCAGVVPIERTGVAAERSGDAERLEDPCRNGRLDDHRLGSRSELLYRIGIAPLDLALEKCAPPVYAAGEGTEGEKWLEHRSALSRVRFQQVKQESSD
jgi:hypothetical protein